MRLLSVARYELVWLLHSQRYLPPALLYLALVGVLYATDPVQALPNFTFTAGALVPVGGWLAMAAVDGEEPARRWVTITHAGGARRLVLGVALASLFVALVLAVLAIGASIAAHGEWWPIGQLGIGLVAHACAASVGVAVGLACSRLVVDRLAYRVVLVAVACAMVLLLRWVPLVNPLLRAMAVASVGAGTLLEAVVAAVASTTVSVLAVAAFAQ
ncbi:MAG: hypothetical protein J2O49_04050 [Sciscionella sp.]|nr:hypothetical protein [Sciscionella sp.]